MCKIEKEGAHKIAEMLKLNSGLTEFLLGNNDIGNEGSKYIAEALEVNTTLVELSLSKLSI